MSPSSSLRLSPFAWILVLALAVLAGCAGGGQVISGEPPRLDVRLLEQTDDSLRLDLELRNVNDQALKLSAFELSLEHEENLLLNITENRRLEIGPRGRERVEFEATLSPPAAAVLGELAGEQRQSLPWQIQGRLVDADGQAIPVSASGHLYPVPGRPGQFR